MGFRVGQYQVSGHAFDRFTERFGIDPQELPLLLAMATPTKRKELGRRMRNLAAKAKARKQHMLTNGDVVFIVCNNTNTVVTCLKRC